MEDSGTATGQTNSVGVLGNGDELQPVRIKPRKAVARMAEIHGRTALVNRLFDDDPNLNIASSLCLLSIADGSECQ